MFRRVLFRSGIYYKQTRTGAADVTLIEIDAGNDSFDRLIDRRVFENDIGSFAAKLEREFLFRPCDGLRGKIWGRCMAVMLVVSAGLGIEVWPQAKAGAGFHAAINSGKFHGIIWPATPSGCAVRPGNAYPSLSAQPA